MDGEGTKNYTFNISKAVVTEKKDSYVLPVIVLAIGASSLGASIIYLIKVSKES